MNDNPRTALYNAQYEAAIANRMNDEKEGIYTITGRCCESGDIIAKDISLHILILRYYCSFNNRCL